MRKISKNKKNYRYQSKRFNVEQILSLIIIMGTVSGITIPFYIQSSNQISAIREDVRAIQTEMKDFHTKLAVQDLEFKMRLCAIEERNRK